MIKRIKDSIKDNLLQICELLILALCFSIPFFVDIKDFVTAALEENKGRLLIAIILFIIQQKDSLIGLFLVITALLVIRRFNEKNAIMNRLNVYHRYPFWWYWICSKVLNIKKCDLARVPLYMQAKLVLNETFDEYPFDENIFPKKENDNITVELLNFQNGQKAKTVNLVISDTYSIEFKQLPASKKILPTLRIKSGNGEDYSRYFNQKLITVVKNEVEKISEDITINLFSTLNPLNNFYLCKDVFKTGGRGNVKHLYVFQQKSDNGRFFYDKGVKIY